MSRCLPFPPPGYILPPGFILKDGYIIPPGYILKEIRDESMIKGFKKVVKKDRKHKKKDKKRKERENGADRSNKEHRRKRSRKYESDIASEKSSLTEELEPQTTSQNSCESIILRTSERQSQSPSYPIGGRHNDSEIAMDQKQSSSPEKLDAHRESSIGNSYSTSANGPARDALRVCEEKIREPFFVSSVEITSKHKGTRKVSEEKKLSSSSLCTRLEQEKPSSSHQEKVGPSKPLLCRKCPTSVALDFLNLVENWALDVVERKLTNSEDQEWWLVTKFGSKRHNEVRSSERISQGSSSMMWPTARYLPEAQVYALPFTVPF